MTEEQRGWREFFNSLETQVVYYEAGLRKKGKTRSDMEYQRAYLKAVTCARDAVKRQLEKILVQGDTSA